jgi:tryptophanyl-tRNA synthetase
MDTKYRGIPEIENVIRLTKAFKAWGKILPQFSQAAEMGKMSPEAKRFIAEKIRAFLPTLQALLAQIEATQAELAADETRLEAQDHVQG